MQTRAYRFFRIKTQVAVAPRDFRFARVIIKWHITFSTLYLGPVLTWKHFNVENPKLPITPSLYIKFFDSHILSILSIHSG